MPKPKYLTIEQFAREINLTVIGVLQYEIVNIIAPHHIGLNGQRYYSWEQVEDLKPRR